MSILPQLLIFLFIRVAFVALSYLKYSSLSCRHYVRSSKGKLQNTPYVDLSYKWPGGGLVSTANDLVKFGTAILASYNTIECSTSPNKKIKRTSTNLNKNSNSTTSIPILASPKKSINDNKTISDDQSEVTSNVDNFNSTKSTPILAPPTTKLMLTAATSNVEPSLYPGLCFSLGWMVDSGEQGPTCGEDRPAFFGHTGGAVGCSSVLLVFPDKSEQCEVCDVCEACGARDVCEGCARPCEAYRELCEDWDLCEGRDLCEQCEARGVVVCVLLNLQDVKGVIKLGSNIARQFLL